MSSPRSIPLPPPPSIDIPEIIALLSTQLDIPLAARCMRVSKSWHAILGYDVYICASISYQCLDVLAIRSPAYNSRTSSLTLLGESPTHVLTAHKLDHSIPSYVHHVRFLAVDDYTGCTRLVQYTDAPTPLRPCECSIPLVDLPNIQTLRIALGRADFIPRPTHTCQFLRRLGESCRIYHLILHISHLSPEHTVCAADYDPLFTHCQTLTLVLPKQQIREIEEPLQRDVVRAVVRPSIRALRIIIDPKDVWRGKAISPGQVAGLLKAIQAGSFRGPIYLYILAEEGLAVRGDMRRGATPPWWDCTVMEKGLRREMFLQELKAELGVEYKGLLTIRGREEFLAEGNAEELGCVRVKDSDFHRSSKMVRAGEEVKGWKEVFERTRAAGSID